MAATHSANPGGAGNTAPSIDPSRFESGYLRANGLRFHAVSCGPRDGTKVLLLHGFPEFWYSWRHQLIALADAGYRAIAPDLRGYNLSDKPEGVMNYDVPVLLDDVVGLVQALGEERVHVVGHDWGGAIAWSLAASAQHRQVVRSLTVMNAPHPIAFLQHMTLRQLRRSWYMLLFQLPRIPEAALSRDGYANLRRMLAGSSNRGTFSPLDLDRYVEALAQPGALTAAVNYYRAILRQNPFVALRRLSPIPAEIPVLLLWGERDTALGKELTYNLHDLVSNLRIQYLSEAGHWLAQEQPALVNRALLAFLADPTTAAR